MSSAPDSILIVEDLPDTLAWLRDIVAEVFPSASIREATTLQQADGLITGASFDLALVDLGLPDGSGQDLIRKLRAVQKDAYIVVATIYDEDQQLVTALRNGANGYLLKDENRNKIIEHLMGILSNRAPVSDRALNRMIDHFQSEGTEQIALTDREEDVLQLIAKGYSVAETADMLGLSVNTVKSYLKTVYGKLGISSRAEATTEAIKRRLIEV